MADSNESLFIFRDKEGKRWPRLRLSLMIVSLLFLIGSVLFVRYLIITPQLHLPNAVKQLRAHLRSGLQNNLSSPAGPVPLWLRFSKTKGFTPVSSPHQSPAARETEHSAPEVHLGFYSSWDPGSYDSLSAHAGQLTHLSPEWLTLVDGEGTLQAKIDPRILNLARDKKVMLVPLLRNLVNDTWQPEAVEGLINGPLERQDRFIAALIGHLMDAEAGGVLLDWNQIDPAYQHALTLMLGRLADALHREQMQLWLCVPMGLELKAFDLEALSPAIDRFVAMLHDENSEIDTPGPIASQPWFEGWLQTMLAYGRPSQWVIAIGSYGYDWTPGQQEARTLTFADVLTRARRAGLHDCRSRLPLYNPHFSYMDGATEHTVWFLDGTTFFNQVSAVRRLHAGGIAISRLGIEDPSIWQVLPLAQPVPVLPTAFDFLRPLVPKDTVAQLGDGNFLMIEDSHANGYREIEADAAGKLISTYKVFPSYTTISHQGKGSSDDVAISFDDGPDPRWTPAILDILKERGVKASFFMVGEKMEGNPGIVDRIVREGHEIGVHTYTHPNLADVSPERARLELNATQRLIETVTHRSTFLFRPPYNADSQPHTQEELVPVKIAQELGYLTVSSDIDPEDWSRPGVDVIVQRIKEQRLQGNVILLHDAGGNRSQTVAALPLVIDYLQTRGDRIVSLGELLGTTTDALMPLLPKSRPPLQRIIGSGGFRFLHAVGELGWAFMIVATILVTLRTVMVVVLAQVHRHRKKADPAGGTAFQPPISIVIAAYNEEKVIGRTLKNLLQTSYAGKMEIIVIDDGSADQTSAVVTEIADRDSRIMLLRQSNMGKAHALRAGFQHARQEIIITLDADTIFQHDTIVHLVECMRDERIGAVSGHVKVGNKQTLVARFQDLEYTCGFNLDRRAYQALDCITVVPGAVSAWRQAAVMAAGGISSDTLAEDTDLTLSLHRTGYRIAYAPEAVAWTEAPENFRSLAKQRFRWAFGTMQCLWKHRDMVGNPRYKALGWFSLPSIWFFQILLVAVSPVIDGLLIFSLFFIMEFSVLVYLAVFLCMDLLLALLACWMEGEPSRAAWRILPMRFLYRPLLAWVIWKSIIRAAKGALVGWGKLERSASISLGN